MEEFNETSVNNLSEIFHCDEGNANPECQYCYTSTEVCIHSRYCFMTGEYCSKQAQIQKERKKLYDDNNIAAFIIMNFSDMSDVVYKWKLRTFIESLSKYLYIDKKRNRLYCSSSKEDDLKNNYDRVKKIQVIRSDSEPASNYVICSRICQQIQIADIVIVDVSYQNANVFYEFGMAVALGKMILPICYSESFYKMSVPEILKNNPSDDPLQHHIGCYPWRKDLFEYYGLRYKYSFCEPNTEYCEFSEVTKQQYGFSDIKYDRFPYHEPYKLSERDISDYKYKDKRIGEIIYDKLRNEYNKAEYNDNTLVVYTMDTFLNGEQAGRCIVNFYHNITARMSQEKCFCGERVGVLVQGNTIPENEKDAIDQQALFYSVGEVIQIGLNQATYLAAEDRIKSDDNFALEVLRENDSDELVNPTEEQIREIENFVKSYVKNKGIRVYPNNPVFVDRMRNLLPEDLLEPVPTKDGEVCDCSKRDCFCLYHVMLKTLRYTNEIVVDISNNCLQSLFWLGAAHGSDTYAITVIHEKTDMEKEATTEVKKKEQRYIFDVAGLWTAIFRKHDTEGFYQQLASVQRGIEKHSKLMIPNSEFYRKNIQECLFSGKPDLDEAYLQQWFEKKMKGNDGIHLEGLNLDENHPICLYKKKKQEERLELESYYRNRFWAPMLNYNRLRMYISQENTFKDNEPKLWTAKWDFDAVSRLSHYLSKRTVIGEYSLQALPNQKEDKEANKINFVSIGSYAQPIRNQSDGNLAGYISDKIRESNFFKIEQNKRYLYNIVHQRYPLSNTVTDYFCENEDIEVGCRKRIIKGFIRIGNKEEGFFTQQPQVKNCTQCSVESEDCKASVFYKINEAERGNCHIRGKNFHYEIAQLILWREDGKSEQEHSHFWVELIGCSGPATSALSSLFVDEQQRKECFSKEVSTMLCELQTAVRKRVMEIFLSELDNKLNELMLRNQNSLQSFEENDKEKSEKQKKRYINLVKYTIAFYLDTVLYRYFFPFLSKKDINRIYNGMYNFVNTMKAAKVSPFVLDYPKNGDKDYNTSIHRDIVKEVIESIPDTLRTVLYGFKGLEAFYLVEVSHQLDGDINSPKDTRRIQNIQMMKREDGQENIICFFV